jgi:hypothetical protein
VKKSIPTKTSRWERIKSFHETDCFRFGAGEMTWRRRMLPPSDPIDVAPGGIFPRHLQDQAFAFLIYLGASYTSTQFRAIESCSEPSTQRTFRGRSPAKLDNKIISLHFCFLMRFRDLKKAKFGESTGETRRDLLDSKEVASSFRYTLRPIFPNHKATCVGG